MTLLNRATRSTALARCERILKAQKSERLKGGLESSVELSTRHRFDVPPGAFLRFAQERAQPFRGDRGAGGLEVRS